MSANIRPADAADATAVRRIYAPYVRETAVSFERAPPTVAEMRERIRGTRSGYPWLVCEVEDRVVGYAHAGPLRERAAYRWTVETSVYVDPAHQRRGVGRDLYESLFAILELQGFYSAYAAIALPNPASVAFHAAMGFEPVGIFEDVGFKRGEWHDVQWRRRRLSAPASDPDPPRSIREVRGSDEWEDALGTGRSALGCGR